MGKIIDALIGRVETAKRLDVPGYTLDKALSRSKQIVGKPSEALANTLHGRPLGHLSTRSQSQSRSARGAWRLVWTCWPPLASSAARRRARRTSR